MPTDTPTFAEQVHAGRMAEAAAFYRVWRAQCYSAEACAEMAREIERLAEEEGK